MKNSPKTLLEGGPLHGKMVDVVFNPTARIPYFKDGKNDWESVAHAQYILSEEKKKDRDYRIAKFIGVV